MKILWLSHLVPYPPKSGVQIRAYCLMTELARHTSMDLVAFNQPRLMRNYFPDLASGLVQAQRELQRFVRNIDIFPVPAESRRFGRQLGAARSLLSTSPYSWSWLSSVAFSARVRSLVDAGDYDLIHVDTEALLQHVPPGCNVPVALDHHNVESHMMLRRAQNEPDAIKAAYFRLEGKKLERLARTEFPRLRAHVVCSEEDARRLRELAPLPRIHIAPNGVHFPAPRPAGPLPVDPVRLLFIGGLNWYPNHDAVMHLLRDIWPRLEASFPGIRLDIVGKNPAPAVQALAGKHGGVTIHGFVDDIERYYAEATAFVCPIRDGGGTKLKVVDALAHSLPVIAHPIACEGLDLTDRCNVYHAVSAQDYVDAVGAVLGDPDSAQAIARQGYAHARDGFSAEAIGARLADYYSALVKEGVDQR
ncbi:MAG: glycosyltransferase family 4 protein [Pseudomonadota bacterium]|nr:glycosyltransferase family 4 protein [Pseudomonadota bacterium]